MFRKIKQIIDQGQSFSITTHIDPDGDAVGSTFALYWALRSLGKDVTVCMKDKVPYRYEFLPGPARIDRDFSPLRRDAVFVLDCGSLFRAGEGYEELKKAGPIVSVDHHLTNEAFGAINVLDTDASSTGEIVYRLLKYLRIPLTYEMAVNIYTAIFTDTGSFRYDNTNSAAFRICEKMTRHGVIPAQVARMVHANHPKERFLLLGEMLCTLHVYDGDRIAIAHIDDGMFRKTGAEREHTDGFAEFVREISGIEVAVLLRQVGDRRYKISMRSKGKIDVAAVCAAFGGGGHKNAAGCHIDGSLDEVKVLLLEALKR